MRAAAASPLPLLCFGLFAGGFGDTGEEGRGVQLQSDGVSFLTKYVSNLEFLQC